MRKTIKKHWVCQSEQKALQNQIQVRRMWGVAQQNSTWALKRRSHRGLCYFAWNCTTGIMLKIFNVLVRQFKWKCSKIFDNPALLNISLVPNEVSHLVSGGPKTWAGEHFINWGGKSRFDAKNPHKKFSRVRRGSRNKGRHFIMCREPSLHYR